MMNEQWKPVVGYETLYAASESGRVKSVRNGKIMASHDDGRGYQQLGLWRAGAQVNHKVHRLVCRAFHGPPPEDCQAAHLDGNPLNNRADNLAWVTPKENNAHKRLHGTAQVGERHPRVKLTGEQVAAIRASSLPSRQAAREFGISQSQVVRIRNGTRWAEGIAEQWSPYYRPVRGGLTH